MFSFNSEDMKHKSPHKDKHYIQGQDQLKAKNLVIVESRTCGHTKSFSKDML
jgi:hypothetical protein